MEESHQDHGHGSNNKVGGIHESEDISDMKVAVEDVKCYMIRISRHLRKLILDLHLRLCDLCSGLESLLIETKMFEWILCKGDSFSDIYPLIDGTLTGGKSTYKVLSWRHGSGQIHYVTQSRKKNLTRRGIEMLDMNESVLLHPGKVIKPRARQLYLEGTRDSNQPDSLFSTSSVADNRGGGTEALPQGQGIDVRNLNGLVPQEPAYNASRGRGVPLDIKQENEDLRKMLSCIVCIDKHRCVVFLPCGHMALCWDCAVHVQQKCPICQGDILDRKIALFS